MQPGDRFIPKPDGTDVQCSIRPEGEAQARTGPSVNAAHAAQPAVIVYKRAQSRRLAEGARIPL